MYSWISLHYQLRKMKPYWRFNIYNFSLRGTNSDWTWETNIKVKDEPLNITIQKNNIQHNKPISHVLNNQPKARLFYQHVTEILSQDWWHWDGPVLLIAIKKKGL